MKKRSKMTTWEYRKLNIAMGFTLVALFLPSNLAKTILVCLVFLNSFIHLVIATINKKKWRSTRNDGAFVKNAKLSIHFRSLNDSLEKVFYIAVCEQNLKVIFWSFTLTINCLLAFSLFLYNFLYGLILVFLLIFICIFFAAVYTLFRERIRIWSMARE